MQIGETAAKNALALAITLCTYRIIMYLGTLVFIFAFARTALTFIIIISNNTVSARSVVIVIVALDHKIYTVAVL